jgi:hypothetical protein
LKTTVLVLRLLFGLHFLVNGLNFFFHFFSIPAPHSPLALELMRGLVDTGLFNIVKVVEVATGIALLVNRFVPLALVIAFPVAIGVGFTDVLLIGTWFGGWFLGAGTVLLNAVLLFAYLRYYRPMLVFVSEPGLE